MGQLWDPSLEWVRRRGPVQVGSQVGMQPKGQDPITSVIVQATEHRAYADQTSTGGVTPRFRHTLAPLQGGGTRVTHRLELTEDFPQAMAALLARAASMQAPS